MKQTSYILSIIFSIAMLTSCSQEVEDKPLCLNGVWELQEVNYPDGYKSEYPMNSRTWLRIYDDSCFYQCQITTAPTGTMVDPSYVETYTCIDTGNDNIVYLQEDDTHPLTVVNDSTIIIQENGAKYTWKQCVDIDDERCSEIIGVIKADIANNAETAHRYVFSKAEKKLTTQNHALIYVMIVIVMLLMMILHYLYQIRKNKKRVEMELMRIKQEREARPEPVRQALCSVEEDFHHSDFYLSLRKRISNGERLKKEDWDAIDTKFNSVYPGFASTLMSLYSMSRVEYQVCVLLKLKVSPKEIANVLCKDKSSISSVRSRLYQKVFNKSGSGKDWDEFICSL